MLGVQKIIKQFIKKNVLFSFLKSYCYPTQIYIVNYGRLNINQYLHYHVFKFQQFLEIHQNLSKIKLRKQLGGGGGGGPCYKMVIKSMYIDQNKNQKKDAS